MSSSVTQNTLKNISHPSVYVNSQKKNYLSWPFTTSKSFTHYILILCISEYGWYISKDESLNELWSKTLSFDKQGLAMKPLVQKNKSPKGRMQSAIAYTIQVKVHMTIWENSPDPYCIYRNCCFCFINVEVKTRWKTHLQYTKSTHSFTQDVQLLSRCISGSKCFKVSLILVTAPDFT